MNQHPQDRQAHTEPTTFYPDGFETNAELPPALNRMEDRRVYCHYCRKDVGASYLKSRGVAVCNEKRCRLAHGRATAQGGGS